MKLDEHGRVIWPRDDEHFFFTGENPFSNWRELLQNVHEADLNELIKTGLFTTDFSGTEAELAATMANSLAPSLAQEEMARRAQRSQGNFLKKEAAQNLAGTQRQGMQGAHQAFQKGIAQGIQTNQPSLGPKAQPPIIQSNKIERPSAHKHPIHKQPFVVQKSEEEKAPGLGTSALLKQIGQEGEEVLNAPFELELMEQLRENTPESLEELFALVENNMKKHKKGGRVNLEGIKVLKNFENKIKEKYSKQKIKTPNKKSKNPIYYLRGK